MPEGPLGFPRLTDKGPFVSSEDDPVRYWLHIHMTEAASKGRNHGKMTDYEEQQLIESAYEMNMQAGKGQVHVRNKKGRVVVYVRTYYQRITPIPTERARIQSKRIVPRGYEFDDVKIQYGRPDKIDEMLGPNVDSWYTRTEYGNQ